MTTEPRKTRARIDGDGVKVVEIAGVRRGVWLLVLALLTAGAAGLLALRLVLREVAPSTPEEAAVAAAPSGPAPSVAPSAAPPAPTSAATPRRVHPVRRAGPPPPASVAAPAPTPPELPAFPDEPSEGPSGVALFPPLGTDPPKTGIVVPEDFELPEGYVRHYQATDDGASLPAILMFHPDYEWRNENGDVMPLPPDLIVPPELAPPGMPTVPLAIPPPASPADAAP
jgi:hypothetical protein